MTTTITFADKQLVNVPVFTPGHLIDSRGREKDFTKDDISQIVDAFSQGAPKSVPIKIGHSSDEFNNKVATELGIPASLIKGEGKAGKGAIRLGQVTSLRMNEDGDLVADMTVSEPVAKLITDGMLTGLSSEIQFNREQDGKTFPTVLSGIAFLGAQRPALGDIPSLQEATMLEDGTYADAAYFSDLTSDFREGLSKEAMSGSMTVSNDAASSGDGDNNVYTVPIKDLTRGRQVFASVSAANEITAKRTALRVVENFLFSLTGPLGTALGITGGAILSARLIAGKPIIGGIKGLLKWKFEEAINLEEEQAELDEFLLRVSEFSIMEKIIRQFSPLGARADLSDARIKIRASLAKMNSGDVTEVEGLTEIRTILENVQGLSSDQSSKILAIVRSELKRGGAASKIENEEFNMTTQNRYAEHPDMALCVAKAKADGKDDPEAFCRAKFDEDAANSIAELAKGFGLSEWDGKGIATKVKELQAAKTEGSKFEEETTSKIASLTRKLLVSDYAEKVADFELVPLTKSEKAEKLADIEAKAGTETATMMLTAWEAQQKSAVTAKISETVLRTGEEMPESEFAETVESYKKEHPDESHADAIKAVMKADPAKALSRNGNQES